VGARGHDAEVLGGELVELIALGRAAGVGDRVPYYRRFHYILFSIVKLDTPSYAYHEQSSKSGGKRNTLSILQTPH
jgi:hypothetical protein